MDLAETRDIPHRIKSFLQGETDIITFHQLYTNDIEINDFLQNIVDEHLRSGTPFLPVHQIRKDGSCTTNNELEYFRSPESYPGYPYGNAPFGCVKDYLTQEFRMVTTNVRTASGALTFYRRLFNLFYQYDQTIPYLDDLYSAAFSFALDVIPTYLSCGPAEIYIQENIIPLFPESWPKAQRKKAIKEQIKKEFRSEKGYPKWIQSSEWPFGKNGKPTVFLGKKSSGEMAVYSFRDESDGSIIHIEQFY